MAAVYMTTGLSFNYRSFAPQAKRINTTEMLPVDSRRFNVISFLSLEGGCPISESVVSGSNPKPLTESHEWLTNTYSVSTAL